MMVLVTGSSGFVGEVLVRKLKKCGFETFGIDIKKGNYTDLIQDISKPFGIVSKIDVIIHLAAKLEHDRCSKEEYFLTNVIGTKNLLDVAKQHNSYFIYVSTTAVYGSPDSPITENTPISTNGHYALTKWRGEELCQQYQKDGLEISIVRPTVILGEKRLGIYRIIFKNLYNNSIVPILGDGKNRISFVNVFDFVDFLTHIVQHRKPKLVVNVGGVIPGDLNEIFQFLKKYTSSSSKIVHVSTKLSIFLKFLSMLKLIPLTPWQISVMQKDNYYDNKVLFSTGYQYKYQPIDALKTMADYYQSHYN